MLAWLDPRALYSLAVVIVLSYRCVCYGLVRAIGTLNEVLMRNHWSSCLHLIVALDDAIRQVLTALFRCQRNLVNALLPVEGDIKQETISSPNGSRSSGS